MASANICDSCGNFYAYESNNQVPNGVTLSHYNRSGQVDTTLERYELCPDCLAKIYDIVKKGE